MVFPIRNGKVDAIQRATKEVELPVVKNFLFCFPLRPGLVVWGFFQLAATVIITCVAVPSMTGSWLHSGGTFDLVQMIAMFIFTMIVSILELIFCAFLIYGARSSNPNLLEVCFYYLAVKVPTYFLLWLASVVIRSVMVSGGWYYSNLDPWRYILFFENQALGLNDIVSQLYLLILVNSMILLMKHSPHLPSLYQRLRGDGQKDRAQSEDTQLKCEDYKAETKTEFVPVHVI